MTGPILRPFQTYGVDETVRAFADGRRFVMMNAPTGSGKSLLAAEIARRLGERVFVTTPQTSLVNQYVNDPNVYAIVPDVRTVMGRDNFDCLRDDIAKGGRAPPMSVAEATCYELTEDGKIRKYDEGPMKGKPIPCRYKRWNEEFPECAYYLDKAKAEMAPVVVTTLAYFLVGTRAYHPEYPGPVPGWIAGRLSGRPLLIVDEAHGLEDEVIRFLSTSWYDGSYDNEVYSNAWEEWTDIPEVGKELDRSPSGTDEPYAVLVESFVKVMRERLSHADDATDPREVKFLESLAVDIEKLQSVADDLRAGIPWIVHYRTEEVRSIKRPVLSITPVVAGPYLRRFLWDRAERIVVMSGTFLDPKEDVKTLGADHLPAREIFIPSEFPPEFSPIYYVPAGKLSVATKREEFPKVLGALWRILDIEPGRGVVHAQSFANVDLLAEAMPDRFRDRLVLHKRDMDIDRNELIERFKTDSGPGDVLVSPSVTEGLDLPGDRGEWVTFLKAPYPSLEDERIVRRMALPDGRKWYDRKVLVETVQGRGRVIRSKPDKARCYILDVNHVSLLNRYAALLPSYFLESVAVGNQTLFRNRGLYAYLTYGTGTKALA